MLPQLVFKYSHQRLVTKTSLRFRSIKNPIPYLGRKKRTIEDRYEPEINRFKNRRLQMCEQKGEGYPGQFKTPIQPEDPKIITKKRELPSLAESSLPYQRYPDELTTGTNSEVKMHGTWYDPLFNPHLNEDRNKVNPDEEPFNAIYVDSKSDASNDYTKTRNITTTQLWDYVERLRRIKIAPEPDRRKLGEPVRPMPSGFVPPPESPPDLPYFISRTRNYLLPVYYNLDSDPENCYTSVCQVSGDLWQLEEDLRTYLEGMSNLNRRILTSVHETDARIQFRGKHIHQVVSWLHEKGF